MFAVDAGNGRHAPLVFPQGSVYKTPLLVTGFGVIASAGTFILHASVGFVIALVFGACVVRSAAEPHPIYIFCASLLLDRAVFIWTTTAVKRAADFTAVALLITGTIQSAFPPLHFNLNLRHIFKFLDFFDTVFLLICSFASLCFGESAVAGMLLWAAIKMIAVLTNDFIIGVVSSFGVDLRCKAKRLQHAMGQAGLVVGLRHLTTFSVVQELRQRRVEQMYEEMQGGFQITPWSCLPKKLIRLSVLVPETRAMRDVTKGFGFFVVGFASWSCLAFGSGDDSCSLVCLRAACHGVTLLMWYQAIKKMLPRYFSWYVLMPSLSIFTLITCYMLLAYPQCFSLVFVPNSWPVYPGIASSRPSITVGLPACDLRWGDGRQELTVLDLALLSADATNYSDISWPESVGFEKIYNRYYFTVYRFRGPASDLSTMVVAFRGLREVQELRLNLQNFGVVAAMQFSNKIISYLSFVPMHIITFAVSALRIPSSNECDIKDAEEYVRNLAKNQSKATLLLTGYDTGAFKAAIIGARLRLRTVVFSAPGTQLQERAFDVNKGMMQTYVVNIKPDFDFVPSIDIQQATVQEIPCTATDTSNCHRITSTICTLQSSCGDIHGRIFPMCSNTKIGTDSEVLFQ